MNFVAKDIDGKTWHAQKTLDARWHAFNDGVSRGIGEFDPAIHYYRPIPQSYLDGVTNNSGAALTNEEKRALQNPGY